MRLKGLKVTGTTLKGCLNARKRCLLFLLSPRKCLLKPCQKASNGFSKAFWTPSERLLEGFEGSSRGVSKVFRSLLKTFETPCLWKCHVGLLEVFQRPSEVFFSQTFKGVSNSSLPAKFRFPDGFTVALRSSRNTPGWCCSKPMLDPKRLSCSSPQKLQQKLQSLHSHSVADQLHMQVRLAAVDNLKSDRHQLSVLQALKG